MGAGWVKIAVESLISSAACGIGYAPSICLRVSFFLLSWSVRIALIAALFCLSFWIVLVVVAAVVFSLLPIPDVRPFGNEDQDHRLGGFYDPIDYNDDPDSRFDDK